MVMSAFLLGLNEEGHSPFTAQTQRLPIAKPCVAALPLRPSLRLRCTTGHHKGTASGGRRRLRLRLEGPPLLPLASSTSQAVAARGHNASLLQWSIHSGSFRLLHALSRTHPIVLFLNPFAGYVVLLHL